MNLFVLHWSDCHLSPSVHKSTKQHRSATQDVQKLTVNRNEHLNFCILFQVPINLTICKCLDTLLAQFILNCLLFSNTSTCERHVGLLQCKMELPWPREGYLLTPLPWVTVFVDARYTCRLHHTLFNVHGSKYKITNKACMLDTEYSFVYAVFALLLWSRIFEKEVISHSILQL